MLIPYGDDSDPARRPYATWGLIAANALVFVALDARTAIDWALRPADFSLVTSFTSMFLHADVFHLAGNMLFLWISGPAVEDKLGRAGFLGFYLGAGLAADLAHVLANLGSSVPSLGASGAISGVIAAYAVLCTYRKVRVFYFWYFRAGTFEIDAGWAVGLWFVGQLFWASVDRRAGGGGGIAYGAHIGGALAGAGAAVALLHAGLVTRDLSPEAKRAAFYRALGDAERNAPRPAVVPERSEAPLSAAIARVVRAGPVVGARDERTRYDIVLLVGDERSASVAARLFAQHDRETFLDVHARVARTGILASGLTAREAANALAPLVHAGIAAVAVAPEAIVGAPVSLRAPRVTADGIEAVEGLDACPVEIRWNDLDAAEALVEPDGARAFDALAGGRRFRLRPLPPRVQDLARAIRAHAPSPLGVGRALRAIASGGALRRLPPRELAEVLGCLAALGRADRAGRAIPARV